MGLEFEGGFDPITAIEAYSGASTMLEGKDDVDKLNFNLAETVAYGAAGMVANVADSMFDSVEPEDVEAVLSSIGKPLGAFYKQNQAGIALTGDIAFSFVPGIGATKLIQAPGALAKAVKKVTNNNKYAMSMFSTGKTIHQLTNPAIRQAVRAGVKTRSKSFADSKLRNKAIKATTFDLLKEGIAADLGIAVTMSDSEIFFPDEMSTIETLAMFGVPTAAIAGLGNLATRAVIKTRLMKEAAPAIAAAENPLGLKRTDAFFHPGNRGVGITMLATQRAELESALASATDNTLKANLVKEANVIDLELQEQAYRLMNDDFVEGLTAREAVAPLSKDNPVPPEINTVAAALKADPNYLFDAISLQKVDSTANTKFDKRQVTKIESLDAEIKAIVDAGDLNDSSRKAIDKLVSTKLMVQQSFNVVLEPSGELSLSSMRKSLWQDGPRKIIRKTDKLFGDAYATNIGLTKGKPSMAAVGDDFNLRLAKAKGGSNIADLNTYERSAVLGLYQKAIENHKPGTPIVLTDSDPWMKKEAALILLEADKTASVKFSGKSITQEELQLEILSDKFNGFQTTQNRVYDGQRGLIKLKESQVPNELDLVRMYNLPGSDSNGISPLFMLFREIAVAGDTVKFSNIIRGHDSLNDALTRVSAPAEATITGTINTSPRLRGEMMNIATDRKPVAMIASNPATTTGYVTQPMLNAATEDARAIVINNLKLSGNDGADIVSVTANSITARPDMYNAAKDVSMLRHGSAQSGDAFVQGTFAYRGNPTIQAADLINDIAEKEVMQVIKAKFQPHTGTFSKLQSKNYRGDLDSLAITRHALGNGWDMVDDVEAVINTVNRQQADTYQLYIKGDSSFNQKRWKELYPDSPFPDVSDGAVIPLPEPFSTKPLQTTALAFEGITALTALSRQTLDEVNALNKAQGRPAIAAKAWHLPPKDLSNKDLVFLVDSNQKLHSIVSGPSYAAAKREADNAVANSDQTLIQLSSDDLGRHFELNNEAFGRPVNYVYAQGQTGRATGKSFSSTIETGHEVLQSMVASLQKQMESIGKQTRGLMFEPELGFAKRQLASSDAIVAGKKRATPWDYYANRIYGSTTLNKNTSFGKMYYGIESIYNEKMQSALDKLAELRKQGGVTKSQAAEYKALTGTGISPFDDINDFIAKTTQIQVPQELRKHAAVLNYTAAALALRIMDVGMGVINTLSLGATIPPVIKMMQKMDTESLSEWKQRIQAFGSPVSDGNAILNPTKTVTSAMHFWYSDEGRDVLNRAAKKGLIQQEVAERLSVIVAPQQGYAANLVKNGIDKLSWITDKTEIMSRGASFITGYYVAAKALKLNDEASMAFAHNFANKSIGDYRPNNRPQMFQGAAGLPLGLFTTFMMNFLQRVYGTIENKQMGAVLNQVGMQTLLFGANSLPGFDAYMQTLTDNYDGSVNMVDRLVEAYGEDGANVFLSGPISAFTNINIASRGDITMPFSREGGIIANVPSFSMVGNTFKMMGEMADNLRYNEGFSGVQAGESIQQYSINRFTRSMMDMWHGYSIDKRGNMLEDDLYTPSGVMSRVLGFKTTLEHNKQMEGVRTRMTNLHQTNARLRMSESFKASARAHGTGAMGDEEFNEEIKRSVATYVKSGGRPENYANALKRLIMSSRIETNQMAIFKALGAQDSDGNLARLLMLQQEEQ